MNNEKNEEIIGKVKLDLSLYPGEDYYSDGDIEDVLLDIVKNNPASDYEKIIQEKKSWPILYHLSENRQNIINWHNKEKDKCVLEVGAGCGAITGALAELFGDVTAIDLSKRRSTINAYRNKDADNISIKVGNFESVVEKLDKKFDVVTLIGVFEYGASYINSEKPYDEFLLKIASILKPGGELIIAIENKLGLKYFAGCKEDHTGVAFDGIADYEKDNGVRTFSKNELKELLNNNGYENEVFYYPYPDYKLPEVIYSDEFLPGINSLTENMRNLDQDRYQLFDENKAFDSVIKAGLFGEMSNSFLVVAYKR